MKTINKTLLLLSLIFFATFSGYSSTILASTQPIKNPARLTPNKKILSIFWCGFSGTYCGQSTTDNVLPQANLVILAFANTVTTGTNIGSIVVDKMPTALINNWHATKKQVIISVGGQNGHWGPIFSHPQNFINSAVNIINTNKLDGIDLDIEGYTTPPLTVIKTIKDLRKKLDEAIDPSTGKPYSPRRLIVVSPENITVYPQAGIPVPTPDQGGTPWNYFVPIINAAINDIDYVQPQFYNNPYLGNTPGTADYIEANYLGWLNQEDYKIPNFSGVPANKLIMGLLASSSAGGKSYYATPEQLDLAFNNLEARGFSPAGVMLWDSHWDTLNNHLISEEAANNLGL